MINYMKYKENGDKVFKLLNVQMHYESDGWTDRQTDGHMDWSMEECA